MKSWQQAALAAATTCSWVGVGASELDVVLHAVLEEIHILKDHGDVPQQALASKFPHVVAADGHGPAVRIVEPGHQIANGALCPEPDGPTMAVVVPWGAVKVTSWSTSRWP